MRPARPIAVVVPLLGLLACDRTSEIRAERMPRARETEHTSRAETPALGLVPRVVVPLRKSFSPPNLTKIAALDAPDDPEQCREGQRRRCPPIAVPGRPPRSTGGDMVCFESEPGRWTWDHEACGTPLVVAFDEAPVVFVRPGDDSAAFAIGAEARTEWVSAATPWLGWDRDGDGCVSSQDELFGVADGDATGFARLARLDANGDGVVDARDPSFAALVLWADANADRRCTSDEIVRLPDTSIASFDARWSPAPPPTRHGSREGETSSFTTREGRRGRVVDVLLAPMSVPR